MPDTPDFDQIARGIVQRLVVLGAPPHHTEEAFARDVAEQLRLAWNARGAADRATLEATLPGAYTKTLDHALRTLDR